MYMTKRNTRKHIKKSKYISGGADSYINPYNPNSIVISKEEQLVYDEQERAIRQANKFADELIDNLTSIEESLKSNGLTDENDKGTDKLVISREHIDLIDKVKIESIYSLLISIRKIRLNLSKKRTVAYEAATHVNQQKHNKQVSKNNKNFLDIAEQFRSHIDSNHKNEEGEEKKEENPTIGGKTTKAKTRRKRARSR